ncbi:3,4-dihydroxy-2-butanone-4-phosphate synthase, partial [Pseudonocardia sp. GCM10023141]|uniref:3,4-dihydroxy-2-butanone-4-phosphate synthase n=1 Tax=Pseudonocardia sp. GCM10023141 TaxID=3252653 RepID=UPI0036178AD3
RHALPREHDHRYQVRTLTGHALVRAGHTEATTDLLRLAGRRGAGVISELVDDDGEVMRGQALTDFAAAHHLSVLAIADLVRYRRATEHAGTSISELHHPERRRDYKIQSGQFVNGGG